MPPQGATRISWRSSPSGQASGVEARLAEVLRRLQEVYEKVPKHAKDDILGSMTTQPHPLALMAYQMFQNFNVNDEVLYSPLRELEEEAVRMMGEFVGCRGCTGMITTGGTESNIAALYLAREHGYRRVYAARTAHHSVAKAARILGLEYVQVGDRGYRLDVDDLRRRCRSEGPGVVVVTVGTTGVGTIDPVEEASEAASECGSVVHVDAAYGGFVAPFAHPDRRLGFENGAVTTLTMDPHKLGLAPLQAGGLLVRDEEWLRPLRFEANYLPAGSQLGLLGTRSAGPVAATWAMLSYLGRDGYRALAMELMRRLSLLEVEVGAAGLRLAAEPEVPIACIEVEDDRSSMKALWGRGIYVYTCGVARGVRVVIMPHVTEDKLRRLVSALRELEGARRAGR